MGQYSFFKNTLIKAAVAAGFGLATMAAFYQAYYDMFAEQQQAQSPRF